MNSSHAVVMGTLKPDGTLELDEKPPLPPARVQVTLQVVDEPVQSGPPLIEVLDQIRKDQEARGFVGRSRAEIDAELAAGRNEEDTRSTWPPPSKVAAVPS
jgi:hypothetical protein